jgi:hypothetical protein
MTTEHDRIKAMMLTVLKREDPDAAAAFENVFLRKVNWEGESMVLVRPNDDFIAKRLNTVEVSRSLRRALDAVLGMESILHLVPLTGDLRQNSDEVAHA